MSGRPKAVPFDSKEYWETRFSHEEPFDWLLTWDDIRDYLQSYLSPGTCEPILHLGCGNSLLAFQMIDSGYRKIVNVDYSSCVIEKMKQLTAQRNGHHDDLIWITADCIQDLGPARAYHSFYPVAIEKSLTDCIACGDDDQLSHQRAMASQIASVQPPGGVWISVSFSDHRQPLPPYHLVEKIPVLVPQKNEKPGAPDIYYYLYVLQKN
ncbi:hypothetical protein BC941DRAFT_518662 [Chlamydoabsidia padenii]|nr:hypothetical protein BC941DRAFT_518662 [Chlamydoabsidia padenii]